MDERQGRRNVLAAAAAGCIGFTGFTLVMPFLPLYIAELGTTDVREIAMWTGLTLGATPTVTAISAPLWGRVGDRYGSKVLVIRSLIAFILTKAGDGVRDRAVAAVRAAGVARRVCRLRRADDLDGRRVGAARSDGAGHRHGADRPPARARRSVP